MRSVSGFTFVQVLIYLVLALVMTGLLFLSTARTYTSLQFLRDRAHAYAALQVAGDLLARDIQMASINVATWKKISETHLIWHTKNGALAWHWSKSKLERIEGNYNNSLNSWPKAHKGLAVDNIKRVTFSARTHSDMQKKKYVDSITFILQSDRLPEIFSVQRTVHPRNQDV